MKTVRTLLCVLLLMATLTLPAQAADATPTLVDSCKYGQSVDLSEFQIPYDELDKLFNRLQEQGLLPWYTTSQYSYSYDESTGIVQTFTPSNLPDSYDRTRYEEKLAEVMARCIHPGMTPEEIALSVHDYLILMGRYDETLQKNTAYDLLINGTTVCAGYTVLYQDILNRAGIPCMSVTSEVMEHTWNLVQLNGHWYHVDLTWDDPTPDMYGTVKHTYFLLTDAQISDGEKPHYGWSTTTVCNDDSYRLAYWRDLSSPVLFPGDGHAYYLKQQELSYQVMRRELSSGKETELFREKSPTVLDFGSGSYTYYHTGLSYWDGKLYFGTLNKIHAMTLTGQQEVVYEYDTAANRRYIYSCYVQNDTIYMATATHDGDFSTAEAKLTLSQEQLAQRHTHSYTQTHVEATCSQPGYTVNTCDCGLTFESDHKLLPHTYAPADPVGNKAIEKCTACGKTKVTGTIQQQTNIVTDNSGKYGAILKAVGIGCGVGLASGLLRALFKKRK